MTAEGFCVPVKVCDGTAPAVVMLSHYALEQMFERRFDFAKMSTAEGKTILRQTGQKGQRNIYDYHGRMSLTRLVSPKQNCHWKIEKFLDKKAPT